METINKGGTTNSQTRENTEKISTFPRRQSISGHQTAIDHGRRQNMKYNFGCYLEEIGI